MNDVDNLRCFLQNILSDHYKDIVEETAQLKKNKCNNVWNELQPYFCNSFAWAFGTYSLIKVIIIYLRQPERKFSSKECQSLIKNSFSDV